MATTDTPTTQQLLPLLATTPPNTITSSDATAIYYIHEGTSADTSTCKKYNVAIE